MRRTLGLLLFASAALASCRPEEARETLLIAGSSTMNVYLEPVVEAFRKKHKDTSIVTEPGGSTAGLVALKHGAVDVATVAREVTAQEDDTVLRDYLVARDGIAIIVHPQNPLTEIRLTQIRQICSGETTAWKDLARPGVPLADLAKLGAIVLVDREKRSKTRRSLIDLVMGSDDAMRGSKEVTSNEGMIEAIGSDLSAIGFASLRIVVKEASVRVLQVDGVEMRRETLLSGRYALTRSFYLAVYQNPPPKHADELIAFALGPEGQKLLEEDGLLGVH